jgi:hypothetical protein
VATRGSEALLARLSRLNLTTVFLAAAALVLAGLLLPAPVGGVLLLLLAGGLVALLSMTWPLTPPRLMVIRIVVLTALIALGIMKFA